MRVIERVAAHYDVREVEFGRVYRWCPEGVVVECDCGEMVTLTSSMTTCECGADHAALVEDQEEVVGHRMPEDDETLHPWRSWRTSEETGLPC